MLSVPQDSFRLLVQSVKDYAISILDPKGNVRTWNRGAEAIQGYTESEILGTSFTVFYPREAVEAGVCDEMLQKAQEVGVWEYDGPQYRKDGVEFSAHVVITALRDDDGQLMGFAKVMSDVTERRRSQMILHSVLDNTLEGIITIDSFGKIQAFNKAAEQLFGYTANDVLGKNVSMLMPNPDRRQHDQYLRNYEETGVRKIIGIGREVQGQRRDGSVFPLELAVAEVQVDRQKVYTGLLRDLTERKRLEEQLRQAQKMEAVGQLAAGVAHDFNNLLAVIVGNAETLLEDLPSADRIHRGLLQEVLDSVDRAASLTRQLLTFSAQQTLTPVVLDLPQVLSEFGKLIRRLVRENIHVEIEAGEEIPPIKADRGQIEQVIINLVINAQEAMPDGGSLHVSLRAEHVQAASRGSSPASRDPNDPSRKPSGRFAVIIVSDTGHGMTPEVRSRIFEPFFTTKPVGKGTGLGLATVYGIVRQSEGWIDVSSAPGIGTTFTVYFPAHESLDPRKITSSVEEKGNVQGHETILLVEDEEQVRNVVRNYLSRRGYNVLTARSGVDALRVWKEQKDNVDLLLTDLVMPEGVTGKQLAEKLLSERPDLKVLYTSGYSPEVAGKEIDLREGFNFLPKPYRPQMLVEAVRRSLDG